MTSSADRLPSGGALARMLAPRLVHEAVVVNAEWSPRCRPYLHWTVPLTRDMKQVTCIDCHDMEQRDVIGERYAPGIG